jgi:hypothetical protein
MMTFGRLWFRAKKCLTETWDESQARKAHDGRQLYVALVGKGSAPSCFVEVNNTYIGVGFLDPLLREYLGYTFQECEPGRLFLSTATRRQFEGDSDRVKSGTTYCFKPDGSSSIAWENFVPHSSSFVETRCNVVDNWEPYPVFGQYESIIRENRWNNKPIEGLFPESTRAG